MKFDEELLLVLATGVKAFPVDMAVGTLENNLPHATNLSGPEKGALREVFFVAKRREVTL